MYVAPKLRSLHFAHPVYAPRGIFNILLCPGEHEIDVRMTT